MPSATDRQTDPERGDGNQDDHSEKLQLKSPPPLQEDSHQDDSSRTIYSMYSQLSEEEDNKMVDRWQRNADSILIFAGLFSAAVAALLAVSIQDLRPNSQDTSAFYLANIYQVLADSSLNLSQTPARPPVSGPPPFSAPRYAVWVNSLWFLSLVLSLTCASLATSVQQWARRYLRVTQPPRCSPEKRARTRAFFAGGVDKMHVPWAVESLPALLHLSLFLFLTGVIVFLNNVNHSVYLSVLLCVGLFIAVYGWITFMPVLWPESPYYTPLSTAAVWVISIPFLIACLVYLALLCASLIVFIFYLSFLLLVALCLRICPCIRCGDRPRIRDQSDGDDDSSLFGGSPWLDRHFHGILRLWARVRGKGAFYVMTGIILPRYIWLLRRLQINMAMGTANISRINVGILDWSVVALGEDEALEKFFEAIPAFLNSQKVKDLKRYLPDRSNFNHRALIRTAIMPTTQAILLPTFLPHPGEQLRAILPNNHDSLASVLGLALAYLKSMHPAKTIPDESMRASGHILSLLFQDPLTQSLLPKGTQSHTAPTKELTALQSRLTSMENLLANLAKATSDVRKDIKAKPQTTPSQPAKAPPKAPLHPAQPSYAGVMTSPQRPSVVVEAAGYTWSDARPSPADICATINATLDRTNPTQVRMSAARWTAKGNLVIWGSASTTATQLTAALPHFTEALQTSLSATAVAVPQSPPKLRQNVKWSKLRINAVPTGRTETRGAFTPSEVHQALATENPSYASLSITQQPSWVRDPANYAIGTSSSLSFAFEDPDGTGAQQLLRSRTLYAFGHVITVKRWKETPPKKKPSLKPPKTSNPASTTSTQALGQPAQTSAGQPSVYNAANNASPSWSPAKQLRYQQAIERKAAMRERREGPTAT